MTIQFSTLLYGWDIMGVAVFAISGGFMAAERHMDLFGFIVLAVVTGIGGGTMRDVLLGLEPVFWIKDPNYLLVAAGAGVAVFLFAASFQSLRRAIVWMDAAGLALFAVAGAGWAIRAEASFSITLVMGVLTGAGGGILRDVLCGQIPLVLRREIYATAALLGAATYALLHKLPMIDNAVAMLAGAFVTFAVRGLAIRFQLSLPTYEAENA